MRNTVILGTVRSGTSMASALFRDTGTSYGDEIMSSSVSNPYGYYECHKINQLNNRIIQKILRGRLPSKIQKIVRPFQPPVNLDKRASMLAIPPKSFDIELSEMEVKGITHFANKPSFCYKDPRFSITLPLWKNYFPGDTRYIVVFRDPRRTVDSMIRNSRDIYNPPLPVDEDWGFRIWRNYYIRLLNEFSDSENWLFVFDQFLFDGTAVPAIEKFVEVKLNTDQINPSIRRSKPDSISNTNKEYQKCVPLYKTLISRSEKSVLDALDSGLAMQSESMSASNF